MPPAARMLPMPRTSASAMATPPTINCGTARTQFLMTNWKADVASATGSNVRLTAIEALLHKHGKADADYRRATMPASVRRRGGEFPYGVLGAGGTSGGAATSTGATPSESSIK